MAIALLPSGHINGKQTTAAVDTTGADLLLVGVNSPVGHNFATDSKGSGTWDNQAYVRNVVGAFEARINYLLAPSPVGAGHTFSTSPTIFYEGVSVASFSGVAALDQAQADKWDTNSTIHPTSVAAVTPTVDGCVVITCVALLDDPGTLTPPAGFTLIDGVFPTAWGLAWAYQIQTTAAAVTPEWTSTNSIRSCGITNVFAPSGGGGGGSTLPVKLAQLLRA